jgi:hypothetical protein
LFRFSFQTSTLGTHTISSNFGKKTPKSKLEVKQTLEIELELGIGLLLEAKLAQKPIL